MYHGTASDFFVGVFMLGALVIGPLLLAIINVVLALKLKQGHQIAYSCFNLIVAGCFPLLLLRTNQFAWPDPLVLILKVTAFGIPLQLVYLIVRLRMQKKQAASAAARG